jgi:2-haloalkanoic acid dehalogenase type II
MDLCFTLAGARITWLSAIEFRIFGLKIPNMDFPYRAVTFDCFGTLIDWRRGQQRVLQALPSLQGQLEAIPAILRARGEIEIELQKQPWTPYVDILGQSIALACQEVCKVSLTDKESQAFGVGQMGWPAFPDTAEALGRLARQVPVGLLSNCDQKVLEICARKHLAAPISFFVSAETVQSYKPAPQHWHAALDQVGCEAHEILHVSFTRTYDLDPAHEMGFDLGFIERYQTPAPSDLPIKIQAPDLAGLVAALGA